MCEKKERIGCHSSSLPFFPLWSMICAICTSCDGATSVRHTPLTILPEGTRSSTAVPPVPFCIFKWYYDGCLVRRKQHSKLPQHVIVACEEHIEAETGLKMRLWEKCLLCGEKLAACTCANAQEPCLDCGETFARCMCDGQ